MPANQRRTCRLPICGERSDAVLELAAESRAAELLDVSAEGFGLRVESPAGIEPGQLLLLRTAGGLHQVGVVHVRPDESGVAVGLRRIADVVERPRPHVATRRVGWLESFEWSPTLIGLAIAAVVGAAIVVAPLLAR